VQQATLDRFLQLKVLLVVTVVLILAKHLQAAVEVARLQLAQML
jgi:hypothetical protein